MSAEEQVKHGFLIGLLFGRMYVGRFEQFEYWPENVEP